MFCACCKLSATDLLVVLNRLATAYKEVQFLYSHVTMSKDIVSNLVLYIVECM